VALVFGRADAGAAIAALGADEIVMGPQAVFGACRPFQLGPNGPVPLGDVAEKMILDAAQPCARHNGYPVALVESLVTDDRSLTAAEAAEEGLSGPPAANREEALARYALAPDDVRVLDD
jgi:membrane-bound ClpP family serine protease